MSRTQEPGRSRLLRLVIAFAFAQGAVSTARPAVSYRALSLGDRVAVMRDGRLQQVSPPREIHTLPESVFVAAFIGTPSVPAPTCG